MTVKYTKRKIGRILYAVQSKIADLVAGEFQQLESSDLLSKAMDDPQVRGAIYANLRKDNIKLVHRESNEPLFRKQTTLLGEKGDAALAEEHEVEETISPDEAGLDCEPEALAEINEQVQAFIDRNRGLQ